MVVKVGVVASKMGDDDGGWNWGGWICWLAGHENAKS
jgi:hypothetical protein